MRILLSFTLRTVLAAAALLALAPAGCSDDRPATEAARTSPVPERGQTPYYYGIIEEYRTVLAGDPHNLAAIIGLGNALFDAGHWREAISYYEQALRLSPHLADVITDMGTCYRNLGMPDRAIQTYQRALSLEPTHQNALFNMGVVYGYDKKEYRPAIEYWERLLHVAPKHPRASEIQASLAKFRHGRDKGAR